MTEPASTNRCPACSQLLEGVDNLATAHDAHTEYLRHAAYALLQLEEVQGKLMRAIGDLRDALAGELDGG